MLKKVNVGRLNKLRELQAISRTTERDHHPDMFIGIDVSLSGSAFSFSYVLPRHYHSDMLKAMEVVDAFRLYRGKIDPPYGVAGSLYRSTHLNFFPETGRIYLSYKVAPAGKSSEREKIAYLAECSESCLKNPFEVLYLILQLQKDILGDPEYYGISKEGAKKLAQLPRDFKLDFAKYLSDEVRAGGTTSATCIEDINVSSQFTGMRAVSIAFGAISATLARVNNEPYYFMATKTMMSSMTKRYNEDIDKKTSEIKAVRKFKNEHKIDTLDFVKNVLGVDIDDDDIADSLGHCFLCENLFLALDECRKIELDVELTDKYVSDTYLNLNKRIIEEYRLTSVDALTKTLEHSVSKTLTRC